MKKATHGAKILSEIVKKLDESELTVQDLGCALRLLSGSSAFEPPRSAERSGCGLDQSYRAKEASKSKLMFCGPCALFEGHDIQRSPCVPAPYGCCNQRGMVKDILGQNHRECCIGPLALPSS